MNGQQMLQTLKPAGPARRKRLKMTERQLRAALDAVNYVLNEEHFGEGLVHRDYAGAAAHLREEFNRLVGKRLGHKP